jgi:hypothetical protein
MQRLSARVVVVAVLALTLAVPAQQSSSRIGSSPGEDRYEYLSYSTDDGAFGQATVHYPAFTDNPDCAFIQVWTGDIQIQAQWTPADGPTLLYVFTNEGEWIYPTDDTPDTIGSLGLAPLPGDPPCDGTDCASCINMQLDFCQKKANADYLVATAIYWGAVAACLAGLIVAGPAGPWVTLICVTSASTIYGAAGYKIKIEKAQCQYDRPRQYCKHAENGQPCLNP